MKKLYFHEMLKDIPLMPLHERDALAQDIQENGQELYILTIGNKIVDGRNRYLACLARGIEPRTLDIAAGKDPKQVIASLNYYRKHWTTQERSHFAALMSLASERGNPETSVESNGSNELITSKSEQITQETAAKQMGVSVSSVKRAKAKIRGKTNDKNRTGKTGETGSVDIHGVDIPEPAKPYWDRKPEAQEVLAKIAAAKKAVKAIEASDPMYCEVNLNGVLSDLRNAANRFAAAIPAHVCPYCKGTKPEDCKACKGRGVVSKYFWDTAVPAELKPEQPF
jgi:hypothetical protein